MKRVLRNSIIVLAAAGLLPACAHISVAPIEVKPIHIIHDINIRVDRQLDEFFAFQEKAATSQPATTQSVSPAASMTGEAQGVLP